MRRILAYFEANKKLTFVLAILWTVVIFIGCSMPGRDLPKVGLFDNIDKVVHFLFFALFFIFWYLISKKTTMSLLIVLGLAIMYGFGLEYYQLYCVEGRSFDVWDGVADTLGALAGAGLVRLSFRS